MTSKERLSTVLRGGLPDHVPVAPDTSNMIPVRLTGKPFWDIYLYMDPPPWKAYIDCVKYFGFDSLMDGYFDYQIDIGGRLAANGGWVEEDWEEVIIKRTTDRIITQSYRMENGKRIWNENVCVYYIDNPPSRSVKPSLLGLPPVPKSFEPVVGRKQWPKGEELLKLVKKEMGDHGLVGVFNGCTKLLNNEEDIYAYYDDPKPFYRKRDMLLEYYKMRFERIMALETKPDFICTGGSGTLIHQTPAIFRELTLPIVQQTTRLAKEYGLPSHIHSCGPEKELVKILYEETDLTVVDPLEIPPMGDCDLKELKRLYGDRLVLKGNLHTTEVMLKGSASDVIRAARQAIDYAAAGGRFILSTGDQCGRDTPDENLYALIETAKEYGRY